jgi:hypothetical protein
MYKNCCVACVYTCLLLLLNTRKIKKYFVVVVYKKYIGCRSLCSSITSYLKKVILLDRMSVHDYFHVCDEHMNTVMILFLIKYSHDATISVFSNSYK